MSDRFRALVVDRGEDKSTTASFRELTNDALPEGDTLVEVAYSTINYKDALAVTGKGKIIRTFPCVPGVDLSGTVIETSHDGLRVGDQVVLTGWGVGEKHSGGFAQRVRLKGDWLLKLPDGLDLKQAMAIGTAGFTAMLSVLALQAQGLSAGDEVIVTGAGGGLGGVALILLSRLGCKPFAVSGRPEMADYFKELGAADILPRTTFTEGSKAPLDSARWPAAIDTVGGATLANLLKAMAYGGTVAACGLAGGADLPTSVFPFILRGVKLIGIESVYLPNEQRREAWTKLAELLPADRLEAMTKTVTLDDVPAVADQVMAGQVRGRTVVDLTA